MAFKSRERLERQQKEAALKSDVLPVIKTVEDVAGKKFHFLGSLRVREMEPEAFADLVANDGFGSLAKPASEKERAERRRDALDTTAEYDPARNELVLVPAVIERNGLDIQGMAGRVDERRQKTHAQWVRDYCIAYVMAAELAQATGRFQRPRCAPKKELDPAFASTVGLVDAVACETLARLGYDTRATRDITFLAKHDDSSWLCGTQFMAMLDDLVGSPIRFALDNGPARSPAELFNPEEYLRRFRPRPAA